MSPSASVPPDDFASDPHGRAPRWLDRSVLLDPRRCPSCSAPLTTTSCGRCGLDVSGRAGAVLWEQSQQVADHLAQRDAQIRSMFPEAIPAATPGSVPQLVPAEGPGPAPMLPPQPALFAHPEPVPMPAPQGGLPPLPPAAPRPPRAPYPPQPGPEPSSSWTAPTSPSTGSQPKKSWSIQNVLLILGAVLLGSASLIFLAFSWGQLDMGFRALVIAGLTALTFGAARTARVRGLRASAEAIASVGSLMLVLDAWALYATGLLDWGRPSEYLAFASVVTGFLLIAVGLGMRLVAPRLIGTALIPLGALCLASGQATPLAASIILSIAACCGLVWFIPRIDRPTAQAALVAACVLLPAGAFAALISLSVDGTLHGAAAFGIWTLVSLTYAPLTPGGLGKALAGLGAGGMTTTWLLLGLALSGPLVGPDGRFSLWGFAVPLAGAFLGVLIIAALTRVFPTTAIPLTSALAASAAPGEPGEPGEPGQPGVDPVATRTALGFTIAFVVPVIVILAVGILMTTIVHGSTIARASLIVPSTLLGLVVFQFGTVLLRLLGISVRLCSAAAAWTSVLIALALPSLLPGTLTAVLVWLGIGVLVTLGITLASVAARRVTILGVTAGPTLVDRPSVRLPLRFLSVGSIALAALGALTISGGGWEPLISRMIGDQLLAGTFGGLAILLALSRLWSYPRTFTEPGVRTTLAVGALLSAATGITISAKSLIGLPMSGGYVSSLFLVLTTLALLIRRLRTPGAAATGINAYLGATVLWLIPSLFHIVFLANTADATAGVGSPALLNPTGLAVVALALTLGALTHAALLTFRTPEAEQRMAGETHGQHQGKAPDQRQGPDFHVSQFIGALALAPFVVATATAISWFDTAHSSGWGFLMLSLVVVLPLIAGLAIPAARRRRAGLEVSTLVVAAILLLFLLPDATRFGTGLLIAAAGAFALAVVPGRGHHVWSGFGLTVAGVWTLAGAAEVTTLEAYTAPLALLFCAIGIRNVARHGTHRFLILGLATLTVPTALSAWDGQLWRGAATVGAVIVLGMWVAVGHRTATRRATSAPSGAGTSDPGQPSSRSSASIRVLTSWAVLRAVGVLSLTLTALGPGALALGWTRHDSLGAGLLDHIFTWSISTTGPLPIALLWLSIALVLAALTLWVLDAPARRAGSATPRRWGPTLLAAILTGSILRPIITRDLFDPWTSIIALALITLWGVLAVLGTPPGWPAVRSPSDFRTRATPPLIVAILVAWAAASASVLPWDVLTAFAGGFIAWVTVRAARLPGAGSTWGTVTFGVLAVVGPFSVTMLIDPTGWRVACAVLSALGWLLFGLRMRWQAPVSLGMLGLAIQVGVLAGPPALAAASGLEGWVALALAGVVLLLAGLFYERQVTRAKTIVRRFSDLR